MPRRPPAPEHRCALVSHLVTATGSGTDSPPRAAEILALKPAGDANDDALTKVKIAAGRILRYDNGLGEEYLGELLKVLPTPEQEAQLNLYKSTPQEELDFLAPADRLLVELLRIDRLKPRLRAMIYREKFLENIVRFEDEALRVYEAAQSLLEAPHFAELLKVRTLLSRLLPHVRL